MAKCTRCRKSGLFLKLSNGLCKNCQAEVAHEATLHSLQQQITEAEAQLNDKTQLLTEAKAEARTQAHELLEKEFAELLSQSNTLKADIAKFITEKETLEQSNADSTKNLANITKRTEKLKPLAQSIRHAFDAWVSGEPANYIAQRISDWKLEDLLPQPELNCLTIKQLKSRYTALRKQIVDVCTAYESRYTTKSNAALYKLMVLALEAELENILTRLQYGKLETGINAVRDLTAKYYAIAADGNQSIAPTLKRFIGQIESLYLDVVATEYEYYVQRERAREEQRAIKEQMRQEAEERKRLEQERKQIEAEEKKYQQEISRIAEQMQKAHDSELEKLKKRLEEMQALVNQVEEKKAEIINLQNGKAGTVYIISNIGSFGDHVFKIGMTRRLEPQDRVNELGDASVPFPFDVHSFIFSEDAVALENALHKELHTRRVNKVNLRKEFFDITIEELQAIVERIDPTAPFKVTALADQYRQSLSITSIPETTAVVTSDDE